MRLPGSCPRYFAYSLTIGDAARATPLLRLADEQDGFIASDADGMGLLLGDAAMIRFLLFSTASICMMMLSRQMQYRRLTDDDLSGEVLGHNTDADFHYCFC